MPCLNYNKPSEPKTFSIEILIIIIIYLLVNSHQKPVLNVKIHRRARDIDYAIVYHYYFCKKVGMQYFKTWMTKPAEQHLKSSICNCTVVRFCRRCDMWFTTKCNCIILIIRLLPSINIMVKAYTSRMEFSTVF